MVITHCVFAFLFLATTSESTPEPEPLPDSATGFVIFGFGLDSLDFSVEQEGAPDVDYEPNVGAITNLKVGYLEYTASAGLGVGLQDNKKKYGTTDYMDFRLSRVFDLADRDLFVEGFYQNYKGFYLEKGDETEIRSDLSVGSAGAGATFFFNRDFSYTNTFDHYTHARSRLGSFVLRLGLLRTMVKGDDPIVPSQLQSIYGKTGTLTKSTAYIASLTGGYVYDLVFLDSLFASAMLLVGGTVGSQEYKVDSGKHGGFTFSPAIVLRGATGYAGETFMAGLNLGINLETTKVKETELQWFIVDVRFFVGMRY